MRFLNIVLGMETAMALGIGARGGTRSSTPGPEFRVKKKSAEETGAQDANPDITEHTQTVEETSTTVVSDDGRPQTRVRQMVSQGVRAGGNFLGKRAVQAGLILGAGTGLGAVGANHYLTNVNPDFCKQNPGYCQAPTTTYQKACQDEWRCFTDEAGHEHCKRSFVCSPQQVTYDACMNYVGDQYPKVCSPMASLTNATSGVTSYFSGPESESKDSGEQALVKECSSGGCAGATPQDLVPMECDTCGSQTTIGGMGSRSIFESPLFGQRDSTIFSPRIFDGARAFLPSGLERALYYRADDEEEEPAAIAQTPRSNST